MTIRGLGSVKDANGKILGIRSVAAVFIPCGDHPDISSRQCKDFAVSLMVDPVPGSDATFHHDRENVSRKTVIESRSALTLCGMPYLTSLVVGVFKNTLLLRIETSYNAMPQRMYETLKSVNI